MKLPLLFFVLMYYVVLVVLSFFIGFVPTVFAEEVELFSSPIEYRLDRDVSFLSEEIDVSLYKNLSLSFSYDVRRLDATPVIDSLSFGADVSGVRTEVGNINGEVGMTLSEVSSTTVAIPELLTDRLRIYFTVTADASSASDYAFVSNLRLTGERKSDGTINTVDTPLTPRQGKVTICHFDNETDTFMKEEVNMMSIVGGRGHGQHGDDIIPPFWYRNKDGKVMKYLGNDWNTTGRAAYEADCVFRG